MTGRLDPYADEIPIGKRSACWPDMTPDQRTQDADDRAAAALVKLHARTIRADGWTPDRQQLFLTGIADGRTVAEACATCGLSVASVYAFRQRAAGAGFAIGWDAARLLARDTIADTLTARALEGQVERITRPDGSVVERFRYDNRLASTMLARLDRQMEAGATDPAGHAARLVASEFQAYLAQLGDGGPSRAALFLARRLAGQGAEALAPLVAMAHADSFVRANGACPAEIDTSDLDVTARAGWTAGQWARAEAAGLLTLSRDPTRAPQLPQLGGGEMGVQADEDPPVWFHDPLSDEPDPRFHDDPEWRTSFPPPPDYDGDEYGSYGDPDYGRTLTDAEYDIVAAAQDDDAGAMLEQAVAARDRWFADLAATSNARDAGGGGGGGSGDGEAGGAEADGGEPRDPVPSGAAPPPP